VAAQTHLLSIDCTLVCADLIILLLCAPCEIKSMGCNPLITSKKPLPRTYTDLSGSLRFAEITSSASGIGLIPLPSA
jgi:hypothetical protein